MKVLKFGGTSVGSTQRIQEVIRIILQSKKRDDILVVVSAMSGVTNQLIEMSRAALRGHAQYKGLFDGLMRRHKRVAEELIAEPQQEQTQKHLSVLFEELADVLHGVSLIHECSPRVLDLILSFGERLSAFLIATILQGKKMHAEFLDARKLVKTDESFGSAHVDSQRTFQQIQKFIRKHRALQIVTGFIGSTSHHETTTLGRGGSDYTATLFGAALGASVVEIWTDVDGVLTADPRSVPNARVVHRLRYEEAAELSHFGAKVIYPPTIRPARDKRIPLLIKNTLHPAASGTWINSRARRDKLPLTGVTSITAIGLVQIRGGGMRGISGIAARFFHALAEKKINVILISQASSESSICVAVPSDALAEAKGAVEAEFVSELRLGQIDAVEIEKDRTIIAVVGERMRHTPGIAGKIFSALGRKKINVVAIAQGSSELNISIVIHRRDEIRALNAIHQMFFPL